MTVTMKPHMNGDRTRKSLAGQLDRLDSILDGLDQGLTGAITDAVKEAVSAAVGAAVRATVLEILTNPDVLALIRGNIASPPTPIVEPQTPAMTQGPIRRVGNAVADAWAWSLKKLTLVGQAVSAPVRNVCRGAVATYRQVNAVWRLRRPILIALGVGVLVGVVVGYVSAPWLAGVLSGIGAMSATLSAQMAVWTRRLFGGLSMS